MTFYSILIRLKFNFLVFVLTFLVLRFIIIV
nr:MAG TPA: hypothetical protein [Caudoviricetes sp.]